jgi:hypothetical protein
MSTHYSPCLMCGRETACCNDEHCLGIEIYNHPGHCLHSKVSIGEFCSLDCFMELNRKWDERYRIAQMLRPEWFSGSINEEVW